MAQSKLNDFAGKFGKGGPPGLGIGLKLLGFAGALVYGVSQSIYTGNYCKFNEIFTEIWSIFDVDDSIITSLIFDTDVFHNDWTRLRDKRTL